jgi:hypothetical protein
MLGHAASVYVAASALEIDRAKWATAALEMAGLRVVSTWIGTVEAVGVSNPRDASAEQRRTWSVADLGELQAADVVWFLAPARPTRGAWVELGVASALGKHLVCSGDTAQSIFCALGEEHEVDGMALAAIVAWAGEQRAARLLPCPFCGREPARLSRPSTHTSTGEFHAISCFCGGCSTRAWQGGDSAAEVERLWNTRGGHRDLKPENLLQPAAPDDASGEGPTP